MRKLWQGKKFKPSKLMIIFACYVVFIIILGVSYAYFNTTLRIKGVASLDSQEWADGVLPVVPVQPESGTGTQISSNFQSEYLAGNAISSTAQNKFNTVNENYDTATSTYTLNVTKTATNGNSDKPTENFNFTFQIENSSNVTWTNGEVSNTYTSNGNFLSNVSGTVDKTTLEPNGVTTLTMSFTLVICGKNKGTLYNEEITYKVNYLVGSEIRTFTIVLKFNSV